MEKFSFFNSVNGDRRYKAEDWANYFNKFITNGYFPNIASNLQVIASGTNMKVTLRAGAAWINGYMYNNTTDLELTIQTADAVNSRKDRVVLRLDHEKREIKAYVKKGTPSSSPVAPALQRDADAYELAVAEVHVRNGVVVITQEAVTDVRLNKDLCGVVNSLLQADTTMIFNQYWDWFVRTKQKYEEDNSVIMSDFRKFMEDEKKRYNTEFTTWFQNLKNVLDTNTAGNLLNEINKINDKWNATLVELDKKSQALQHGLNVVNAPVDSPLNIEIQGRTLANVLGKDGAVPQTNKVFSVETAKYYLIINSSGTQVTVDNTAQNTPYKFTGKASVSLTWTVGMVALYEVDQATYNKINVDPEYSGQKLMDKFPYVEGVQHLNPVVVVESGNLIPPFTEWTLHANAKVVNPYELELNATATNQHTFISIDCSPNTQYTLDVLTSGFYIIDCLDSLNGITSTPAFLKNGKITFTTPINTKRIQIKFTNGNVATGKFTFSNIMLVVGDKPKPFAPRNPSYLYTNTVLAGQNGINDVLYQEDGQWKVLRKWERDIVLDSAKYLTGFYANYSGYKRFGINPQPLINADYMNLNDQRFSVTKYDGKMLQNNSGYTSSDQAALQQPSGGGLKITVANIDSGFTDSYTPSADEISAYFNGWKVKSADGTGKPTAWVSVVDGKDAPTQTIAYVRANRAPNYTPYKLTYQLATPRVEVVQVEGELVTSGITQVNADNGVVVREKVVPNTFQGTAYINSTSSKLKARVNKILGVYKNGQLDSGWELMYRNGGESDYPLLGKGFARINTTILDPTAEYTVTYLVQDKHLFTTNVIDVKVTYNQSLASTVREVVEKQADNSTLLFAQQAKVSELTAKTREYGLRLTPRRSGKDENDIFTVTEYKMANGMVRKRSVLSNPNAYGSYLTRTETEYLENGAVQKVTLLDLIYDADGNFIDEVERT
ncbi:hypothetical protein [Bacillus paranthracis]|uniref:hypothetical protein n=1 Tax=Bacillus paranthracis TaxID=2026186 RepID=UPI0021D25823|nr:hypothetical protein [Bacillus paranthracis]MCU5173783.1 hypothetical protein [Bacillus paranthracis]